MPISHDDPEGSREPVPDPPECLPDTDDKWSDEAAFQQVLRETISAAESGVLLDRGESEALFDVARRHPGSPLVLDPVAMELIGSLLRTRFSKLMATAELRERISRRIAVTLIEDPEQAARLDRLWTALSEQIS